MIWSFILGIIGIFGLWLAGTKNSLGWLVGIAAQFLWAIYAVFTEQYGFLIACVGYGWVYASNYFKWKSEPR